MRAQRIVAALIAAPLLAGTIYAIVLAYQVASHSGGPDRHEFVISAASVSLVALVFLALVLLPLSILVRKSPRFLFIVIVAGAVAWFGTSVGAFVLVGQSASAAASTALQLLTLGIPTVVVFAAILGKGPHA